LQVRDLHHHLIGASRDDRKGSDGLADVGHPSFPQTSKGQQHFVGGTDAEWSLVLLVTGQWLNFVEAAELFGVGVAMQSAQMNCDDPSRPGAPRLRMSALRDLSDADFHHRLVAIQGKIGATVCMWCNNEWVKANDLP